MKTNAEALQDRNFLLSLDRYEHKIQYARITIWNKFDASNHNNEEIQGVVISGSININGSSSVRRTGNLSIIASENSYRITDVENLISINKTVVVEIGLKNEINVEYPDKIWFKLGTFVISNASITHSLQGININISLKDLMAKLNGECGGTFPSPLIHSPIQVEDGTEEFPLIKKLIKTLIESWSEIQVKDEYLLIPEKIKNSVYWKSNKTGYLIRQTTTIDTQSRTFYILTLDAPVGQEFTKLKFGDTIGYQIVDYTIRGELESKAEETVASVLEKIKNILGNYEYFFDVDGEFHFQEKLDGLNTGSSEINLTDAISYFYSQEEAVSDEELIQYRFNDAILISSYTNTPQYNAIKNDIVVWGVKENSSSALRYHLAIEEKPTIGSLNGKVYIKTDEFGVKRAYATQIDGSEEKSIDLKDWRQWLYFDYIINGNEGQYSKELKEELPKIMDIVTGEFYAIGDMSTTYLNSMTYFLDFIDPREAANENAKNALQSLSVNKIGRRGKPVSDNQINCVFDPLFPNVVFIEAGKEDTSTIREQCLKTSQPFTQIPSYMMQYIDIGRVTNSAYNNLRSTLHTLTSYNETISLQALPIYYLDVNRRIYVKDEKSDIEGDYLVNSISIPLAFNGMMTIGASRALERI